jgi:hypothetical protein
MNESPELQTLIKHIVIHDSRDEANVLFLGSKSFHFKADLKEEILAHLLTLCKRNRSPKMAELSLNSYLGSNNLLNSLKFPRSLERLNLSGKEMTTLLRALRLLM